jgi:hypothetical protein
MMEAEYIAASQAAKEAVWIKNFVFKLGVVPSVSVLRISIVIIMEP